MIQKRGVKMNTIILGLVIILLIGFGLVGARKNDKNDAKLIGKKPLTEVEQIAYWRLKEAAGEEKIVLCQVAFSSILKPVKNDKNSFIKFNKIRQKVADFVICNKDLSIYAIVEIDDKTHSKIKDEDRDKITSEAGIKTLRFEAKKLPSLEILRKELSND